MAMKILILEDNDERQHAMRECLQDRFGQYELWFFKSAMEMIDAIKNHLHETLVVSLDHDLEMISEEIGKLVDAGDGRDVSDYLSRQKPLCPVVIHSTNSSAVVEMKLVLQESEWTVSTVAPYGDLEWVEESWFPAMRQAIVRSLDRDSVGELAEVVAQRLREVEEGTVTPIPSEEVHQKMLHKTVERRQKGSEK
jgi:CheY-like chemotaxis protein